MRLKFINHSNFPVITGSDVTMARIIRTSNPIVKIRSWPLPPARNQSPLAFWSAGGRPISYPESSGFLVSGWAPVETLGNSKKLNFLIGCPATTSIVLPQKSCGNKIPVPQSLYWRPSADQKARGLWVRDWWAPGETVGNLINLVIPTTT